MCGDIYPRLLSTEVYKILNFKNLKYKLLNLSDVFNWFEIRKTNINNLFPVIEGFCNIFLGEVQWWKIKVYLTYISQYNTNYVGTLDFSCMFSPM